MFRFGALGIGVAIIVSVSGSGARGRSYEVLYSFRSGSDGAHPLGGLVVNRSGDLFGTTDEGGGAGCGRQGCGIVFELTANQMESVLYAFKGASDGANPPAGVILDGSGNLYGTTASGGASDLGSVFKLSPKGDETLLHSFTGLGDGASPLAGLTADMAGNLYGTTLEGGVRSQNCRDAYGCGTIFKITPDHAETVLYSFCTIRHCADGLWPVAGLLLDKTGDLYGTTSSGGVANCEGTGCGTVFELTAKDNEKVLYRFCSDHDCTGGMAPAANLIKDGNGDLYGTTGNGGIGYGNIFELTADGAESDLYSFLGTLEGDGELPVAGLFMDRRGNLYGTTELGGGGSCDSGYGCGTVFKLAPDGVETILHVFEEKGKDGIHPKAGLVADGKGYLYGTTYAGGAYHYGTIFRVKE
jgi:uncharacterized repeat protein (TIGR03803 family)